MWETRDNTKLTNEIMRKRKQKKGKKTNQKTKRCKNINETKQILNNKQKESSKIK